MNIMTYLKRIDIEAQPAASLQTLQALQENHLKHIPFGNLDVMRKVPITLDLEKFFKKIIVRKREGYCYELNGLYNWLLTSLDFDAYLIKCTVHRGKGEWAMPGSHAAQIVTIAGEKYLTDVGFGSQNLLPVPLSGAVSEDMSGRYRISQFGVGEYHLERDKALGWDAIYKFSLEKQGLANYAAGLDYNQSSPKSTFTHHDLITIATESGRVTLLDRTLKILANGEKSEREISEDEFADVIDRYFGIDINEVGK